jgi:uncharacterized protein (TIGR02444 family)
MPAPNATPSLWDFALSFYAKLQMAETCLDLQDTYGCNVCLLIGLGWMDTRSKFLSGSDLANLESYIQTWTQQVVEPLRTLRRLLKQPIATYGQDDAQAQLRSLIKDAELLAEKKLLAEIELWLTTFSVTQESNVNSNIERYLLKLGAPTNSIKLIQKNFIHQ